MPILFQVTRTTDLEEARVSAPAEKKSAFTNAGNIPPNTNNGQTGKQTEQQQIKRRNKKEKNRLRGFSLRRHVVTRYAVTCFTNNPWCMNLRAQ